MAQEYNKAKKTKSSRLHSAFSLICFGLMILGILCCIIFLCVGVIGVIRGYSVQSFLPTRLITILIVCIFHEAIPSRSGKKYRAVSTVFVIMFSCYFGLDVLQGRHRECGDEYYEQGAYQQAIEEYKKETETWYLHLKYNSDEVFAMDKLAESYCKVEDFDNARNTYKMMVDRYTGYFAEEAKKNLARIKNGL